MTRYINYFICQNPLIKMSNKSDDALRFIYWHHIHTQGLEYETRILDS